MEAVRASFLAPFICFIFITHFGWRTLNGNDAELKTGGLRAGRIGRICGLQFERQAASAAEMGSPRIPCSSARLCIRTLLPSGSHCKDM